MDDLRSTSRNAKNLLTILNPKSVSRPVVAFQVERLGQFLEDAGAQLVDHWYETEYADHDNWSLDLDHSTFINLYYLGILKIITARVEDKLIGYLAFLLVNHLESRHIK